MITDHLDASLYGKERRNHELYTEQRTSMIYRFLLEPDDREYKIDRLITELTVKAKHSIEEEERTKRKTAILNEAAASGPVSKMDSKAPSVMKH